MQRNVSTQKPETTPAIVLGQPQAAPLTPKSDAHAILRDTGAHVSIGTEELEDEDPRYTNVACTD